MRLFHYTDVNAVKSILENEIFWLTDVRFLNDTDELRNGISTIVNYINHRVKNFPAPHELFDNAAEYIFDGLTGTAGYGVERRPVYACSFSLDGDLLSQWRAYGSYAIEFASDAMPQNISVCIYDEDEKLTLASSAALLSLETICSDMADNDMFLDKPGRDTFSGLMGLAATFKHESFSEEKEVRIVLGHDIDPEIDDGPAVKFRSRGDLLIPYVETSVPFESIRAIHIGPMKHQELAYIAMREFVEKMYLMREVTIHNYEHEIKVIKSKIPYRAP